MFAHPLSASLSPPISTGDSQRLSCPPRPAQHLRSGPEPAQGPVNIYGLQQDLAMLTYHTFRGHLPPRGSCSPVLASLTWHRSVLSQLPAAPGNRKAPAQVGGVPTCAGGKWGCLLVQKWGALPPEGIRPLSLPCHLTALPQWDLHWDNSLILFQKVHLGNLDSF